MNRDPEDDTIDPYPDGEDLDLERLSNALNEIELHNMDAEAQRERQALIDFNQINKDN